MKKLLLATLFTISSLSSLSVFAQDGKMTLKDYSQKPQKIRIVVLKKLYDKVKMSLEEKKGVSINMDSMEAAKASDACMIKMSENKDFAKELKANPDQGEVMYTFKKCLRKKIEEKIKNKKA